MALLGRTLELDPVCKLCCLALLSASALGARPWSLAAAAMACILPQARQKGFFARALKDAAFFLSLAALTAIAREPLPAKGEAAGYARYLSAVGASAALFGARLLVVFWLGRLFYSSTKISDLRDSITRCVRRIPLVGRFDLGLHVSLILGLVPAIFDEWRESLEAARSRGYRPTFSLSGSAAFIAAFLRRLMLRAVSAPEALAARGWSSSRRLPDFRWRTRECAALAVSAAIAAAAALRYV